MTIDKAKIDILLSLIRKKFLDWNNFSNPNFMNEEISYKQATIKKAQDLLSKEALSRLIKEQNFDELITRLDKIGKDNNLLWRSVPLEGDLNVLYKDDLDKTSFCEAMFDLLHGKEESTVRLKRYLDYIERQNLPNKWTFPTYFLFICHPDKDFFVKPMTAKWFLDFLGLGDIWTSKPDHNTYATILETTNELKDALKEYNPRDLVDIQGFIWVCTEEAKESSVSFISKEKKDKFLSIFEEFTSTFANSPEGIEHIRFLKESREQGQQNFKDVVAAAKRGEDVTDLVLLKLLPHANTKLLQEKGAWISIAPAIMGNIKDWFVNSGWTKPEDWPKISKAILEFIQKCNDAPEQLREACLEFSELPYSKGFQAGILSLILNALNPIDFLIVNRKSVQTINYFANKSFNQILSEYPDINKTLKSTINDVSSDMHQFDVPDISDIDIFDMFCHWLVSIKKFGFRETRYWKIAPGENAWNWENCREGGFIAIGWDELGDVTLMSRTEFIARRNELLNKHPTWKKAGVDQVWKLASHIKEGDYIVANRGTKEVLGIGTVIGPCYYVRNVEHGHRLPVQWEDLTLRQIDEGGWRRTLVELDRKKFEEISNAPTIKTIPQKVDQAPDTLYSYPFTAKTFNLLEELHNNPTRSFYSSRKENFKQYLEEPFQRLFKLIADKLPNCITEFMETEKNIFSRILKNDFGRGGAWDFYWGAFYPKRGKRIEDAQLFMSLKREYLTFGFYIGEYGSEQRKKFLKNIKEHEETLLNIFEDIFDEDNFVYGKQDERLGLKQTSQPNLSRISLHEWLRNPEKEGINVALVLARDEVLQLSENNLVDKISSAYEKLFPLVLLATSDNPLPEINEYLNPPEVDIVIQPSYSPIQFADETGIEEREIARWVRAIDRKGQAIFYGPPGTGKTYIAERLAHHLVGGGVGFIEVVQFHPAYAYEDFIQGIRPQARPDGSLDYQMISGRFLGFCSEAKKRSGVCVLIIDEINRANLARVFGELMYLLEYRDKQVPLAGGNILSIPRNVRIIGTMNTADRSIALVDHALRRRFAFFPLYPNYNVLKKYHIDTEFPVEKLINLLKELNDEIGDKHYHVGITFFLQKDLLKHIEEIWTMEIEPYLEEYFFDQPDKADKYRWDKVKEKII